jgi:microcystin-dependent protein
MAEPFLSEIRLMSFNFPPKGWATCNGQLLPINQNQALFSLLGTTYGGNGQVNFALPDLRGRVPIHRGSGHTLGEQAGEAIHTLTTAELPTHTHVLNAADNPAAGKVASSTVLLGQAASAYGPANHLTAMAAGASSASGGSQAHTNMQPYGVLNFCIALQGIFPSQA